MYSGRFACPAYLPNMAQPNQSQLFERVIATCESGSHFLHYAGSYTRSMFGGDNDQRVVVALRRCFDTQSNAL